MVRDANINKQMSAREVGDWLAALLVSDDPALYKQFVEFRRNNPDWLDRYSEDERYDIGLVIGDIASRWMAARDRGI